MEKVAERIESIGERQGALRAEEIREDAKEELSDAKAELEEGKKKAAAPAPKAAPVPAVKPAAAPTVTGPDLSDDAELVAVMTAAIAAYEGSATSNGLVVRSIRRVGLGR